MYASYQGVTNDRAAAIEEEFMRERFGTMMANGENRDRVMTA